LGDCIGGKPLTTSWMMSEAEAGLWGIGFGLAVPLGIAVGERLAKAKHEGILRNLLRQAYVDSVN
jgi:hypothetical protein